MPLSTNLNFPAEHIEKLILLCIVGIFITSCNSANTAEPEPADPALKPGKTVSEARCFLCHSISRPLGKHKTTMEWTKTVNRIRKKAPGKILNMDVEKILAYSKAVRGVGR